MLKHLKMKAAISQQEGLKDDVEEVVLSDEVEYIGKTKIVEEDVAEKHTNPTKLIGPLELPLTNAHAGKLAEQIPPYNGSSPTCEKSLLSPFSDIHKWGHVPNVQMDTSTHSSNAIFNYKHVCMDPTCHCSSRKVYPHSPNLEEYCHYIACQQAPRLMHPAHVPYYHSSRHIPPGGSTHLHPPIGGVFYPPEQHLGHPHPTHHSPTLSHHSGADWARYAEPGFSHVTQNLFQPGSYNQEPWRVQQSHYLGTSTSKDVAKLPLPMSRTTIISLVKSGKCDVILESLDEPLHNESSPLYPLALKTVLEILDVIEKDFTKAYQSDRKVEADIHQLSIFVRNMEKSMFNESSVGFSDPQTVPTVPQRPSRTEAAFQFPDISAPFLDEADHEEEDPLPVQENRSAISQVGGVLSKTVPLHNDTDERMKPLSQGFDVGPIIIGDDIANILATFKAKSGKTSEAGTMEKEGKEDDTSKSSEVDKVTPDPEREKSAENNPLPITKGAPLTKESQCEKAKDNESTAVPDDMSSAIPVENRKEESQEKGSDPGNMKEGPQDKESDSRIMKEGSRDLESDPTNMKEGSKDKESDPRLQATEQAVELQKDQLDLDVVDALLDQTLNEADKARDESNKSPDSVSNDSVSGYRGKGFKIRSIGNTEKGPLAKPKAPVKTFAQIRQKDELILSTCLEKETSKLPDTPPDFQSEKGKDLNGNTLEIPTFVRANSKISNKDSKETTPELPRCPSNPLSPSPSESLDSTDFKSLLLKRKTGESSILTSDPVQKRLSKELASTDVSTPTKPATNPNPVPKNLPLAIVQPGPTVPKQTVVATDPSKESLPNSLGKPLISKSFHGKLLLLKNSKEEPYKIPLEVSDPSVVPRDPRLALSNLMDYRGNHELKVLHWKDVSTSNADAAQRPPVNMRDPRVRRRLSGESCSSGAVQTIDQTLIKASATKEDSASNQADHKPEKESMRRSSVGSRSCPMGKLQVDQSEEKHKEIEPSKPVNIPSSLIKKITECIKDSRLASNTLSTSDAKTANWDKVKPSVHAKTPDCDKVKPSTQKPPVKSVISAESNNRKTDVARPVIQSSIAGHFPDAMTKMEVKPSSHQQMKSVIVVGECAKKAQAEKPKLASALGPLNESVEKMDTKFSFQESLSVLKGIKSDIKKAVNTCGGKMGKVDKEKISVLSQRITVLARAVEISLLTTEVQKKKATGTKFDMLSGILEDHFILSADLIIMGLWLKDETPPGSDKGLPDFRKGVFSRKSAPPLKRIHRWLKNRYEIDGFTDKALSKLVSRIVDEDEEQRSRSRNSSTGSDRHKRKRSEHSLSSERSRSKSMDKKTSDAHHRKSEDNVKSTKDKEDPKGKKESTKGSKHDTTTPEENNNKTSIKNHGTQESDSDSTNDLKETPVHSAFSSSESDDGNPEGTKDTGKRKATGGDGQTVKKCKQSVTVSNCIQDLPQEMSDIKREVLIALSDRNTKMANICLEKLPELSRKAHAQLEDENKTYTSMKNVSPDTRAKFNDVINGIQKLVLDCEIMVYSLSWNANRTIARKAKDTIWTIAQKSSHKPSYEEELALLLSLRKSYMACDLWFYIRNDVDDRIASLQKKCRSSQKLTAIIQDHPVTTRKPSWSKDPTAPASGRPQDVPPMQSTIPVHQSYDRPAEVRYNGPSDKPFGYQNSYVPPPAMRNNFVNGPAQQFPPSNNAMPYHRDGYPMPNQQAHSNFQPHPAPTRPPPPPGEERSYEWWRQEKRPDDWDSRRGKSSPGSYDYDDGNMYTPQRML